MSSLISIPILVVKSKNNICQGAAWGQHLPKLDSVVIKSMKIQYENRDWINLLILPLLRLLRKRHLLCRYQRDAVCKCLVYRSTTNHDGYCHGIPASLLTTSPSIGMVVVRSAEQQMMLQSFSIVHILRSPEDQHGIFRDQ